jgi:uncharacterized protein DUF6949
MLHSTIVLIFAITAGFTVSGIAANLYGIACGGKKDKYGRTAYLGSMVLAGPSVLFERAAKGRREKSCSGTAFFLAAAISGYWSLAIGLFVLEVALAL